MTYTRDFTVDWRIPHLHWILSYLQSILGLHDLCESNIFQMPAVRLCKETVKESLSWSQIFLRNHMILEGTVCAGESLYEILWWHNCNPCAVHTKYDILTGNMWFVQWIMASMIVFSPCNNNQNVQSSAVITRSNTVRFYINNNYRNWGRISIRCWMFVRKLTALYNGATLYTERLVQNYCMRMFCMEPLTWIHFGLNELNPLRQDDAYIHQ